MKKILSLLLVALMIVGMLPIGAIHTHAAEQSVTLDLSDSANRTTFDTTQQIWEQNGITVTNNKGSSSSDVADYTPPRFYKSSEVIISCSLGNITKIELACNATKYATALQTSVGDEATVNGSTVTITPTAASDTYTISNLSGGQVRMGASITVTYATVDSSTCAHTNTETIEAVAATCTTAGNTAGEKCADCGTVLSGNETIEALGHTNDEGVVTEATCTTDGYTLYTCTVCGNSAKSDWVNATGHTYVDGVCSDCSVAMPVDLAGEYYIAAIRSSGNYFYLSNSVNDSSRYVAVDSGLTELPTVIETATAAQVFELVFDATAYTYKIKSGDQYLGWTSGNTGALVDEATAIAATVENSDVEGAYLIHFAATDAERYLALNNTAGNDYFVWYKQGQAEDLYLIPVNPDWESDIDTPDVTEPEATEPETTEPEASEPAEEVKITFELGADGTAAHNDGKSATTYTETVDGYTLDITGGTKMYTGAIDATGNGCIKLGTGSVAGGFTFTVPSDVTQVIIRVAKYKANTTKFSVNGTEYDLSNASNNGVYDEITVDTSSSKTVTVTTVSGGTRAMVNSITYVCGKTDHTCQWDEGTVTKEATCTTDGVKTYSCTVEGCTITITETIKATGHSYVYGEAAVTCSVCDYSAAYTLSTIATAKASVTVGTDGTGTSDGTTYYIKGIVTYVSGKNVYIEDATAGICVYFTSADEAAGIELGDEILVWDTMTAYKGLIETSGTTAQEYVKVSSGNALPSQTVSIADLNADTTNEYLGERVVIENVTIGTINTSGNTALTDADGNTINIYRVSGLNEAINANDVVSVTAIVSTYNAYQLIVNPGTAAADVVEVEHHDEVVIETVTIAEAKAGTAGEYYQVEGVVTFIDGRNVYIQDATGGIVVYLTASAANTAIGDKVKAYGALKTYNGLIELDGVDETNTEFYEVLSNGNTVEAQAITIADLAADTTNEYLAEKITLTNVYVSYSYGYSSSYGNVNYILKDGENTTVLYRVPAASEDAVMAGGTIVTVEAIVSSYNGYQLRVVGIDSVTITGTCAHETTELVNAADATCEAAGYTGDNECTVCGNYVTEGEEIAALGHAYVDHAAQTAGCENIGWDAYQTCERCDYTSYVEIAALGHNYQEVVTAPTCTEQGYTTHTCSHCGDVDEVSDYVDATGHTMVDGVCSVCNYDEALKFYGAFGVSFQEYIGLNAMVNKKGLSYERYYIEAVQTTATGEETEILEIALTSGNYIIFEKQIQSWSMTDEIVLTIYGEKDGKAYVGQSTTTTVESLALTKLATYVTSDLARAKALVDMLNYGAAVQSAYDHSADRLANANLGDYASYGTATTPTIDATDSNTGSNSITVYGPSVSMQSRVEYQFMFKLSQIAGTVIRVTVDGETTEISSDNFEATDATYTVARIPVKASNLRKVHTIALYDSETGECLTKVYNVSIEAYAKTKLGTNLENVFVCMMKYGDAVAAIG